MTQSPIAGNSFQTHPPHTKRIRCAFERHDGLRCYAFFSGPWLDNLPPAWSRGTSGTTYNERKYYCPLHKEEL